MSGIWLTKRKFFVKVRNYLGLYGCNKNLFLLKFSEIQIVRSLGRLFIFSSDYTQKYKE